MESSQLKLLYQTLDDIRHKNGVEYWYARELYSILGYSRWENFQITEKEFSGMLVGRGVEKEGISRVRSRGDRALFNYSNEEMKERLGVPPKRALADFLPNVTLKAKDLATAMTIDGARRKNIQGERDVTHEHVSNNANVREALTKSDIYPEALPPAKDIKKLEGKHRKEMKALQKRQQEELREAARKLQKITP